MNGERAVRLAGELMQLGVSHAGVTELLSHYDHADIERQLKFLPYRKAKRPEAFIIDAIRNNYSAPKAFFYAPNETESDSPISLDENTELSGGPVDAPPLKDTELRLLLILIRQTAGWNNENRQAMLTYRTLSRLSGRKTEALQGAVRSLRAQGLIHSPTREYAKDHALSGRISTEKRHANTIDK